MRRVYIVHIVTESSDHYHYAFKNEPSIEDIAEYFYKNSGYDNKNDAVDDLTNLFVCDIMKMEIL